MRTLLAISALLLFAAVACDDDLAGSDPTPVPQGDVQTGQDTTEPPVDVVETTTLDDATGETTADTADPLPVYTKYSGSPSDGTYVGSTDFGPITINITKGKVFLLGSKFGCEGTQPSGVPCKTFPEVPDLTCNKAFEEGYYAGLVDNEFSMTILGHDPLEGVITSETTIGIYYTVDPGYCCTATFAVELSYSSDQTCEGAEIPDCDPYANTGCPDGQYCTMDDQSHPLCDTAGEALYWDECGGQTGCAEGICMSLADVPGTMCYQLCKTSADCTSGTCLDLQSVTYKVCMPDEMEFEYCNLLTQDCTVGTQACYLTGLDPKPICQPAGTAVEGGACVSPSDCAKGLTCQNSKCYQLCNTQGGDPKCAEEFAQCAGYYGQQSAGICDI